MSLLNGVTRENFETFVKNSHSVAEVIRLCQLQPNGANYRGFNKLAKIWGIDTSHFTGQAHLKGKSHGWANKRPLNEILTIDSDYNTNRLKNRLIGAGLLEHKCSACKNTTWNKLPIPIELDHIDGDHTNNTIENLRILCLNCHGQTPTWRGRNIKRKSNKEEKYKRRHNSKCKVCASLIITNKTGLCSSCFNLKRSENLPNKEILIELWREYKNFTHLGRIYNVSDNAVRKWFIKYGIKYESQ